MLLGKYVLICKSNNKRTNQYKGYKGFVQKILNKDYVFVTIEANGNVLPIHINDLIEESICITTN